MVLKILITLFLVFLNGFFVAAEFALVKVRLSQIEIMIKSGSQAAGVAKGILAKLDAYLSASQLGITVASLLLGYYGEETLATLILNAFNYFNLNVATEFAHVIATTAALVLITVLHIVFGEQAPKTFAIQHPEKTTLAITYPLRVFYFVFRPLIWVLNSLSNGVLRLIGMTPNQGEEVHSPEEIRYLVEQNKESGTMEEYNFDIIKKAFDFTERTARQVMVPRTRIVAVSVSLSSDQIIARVMEEGFSRVPVYETSMDNIVGILHVKDIFTRMGRKEDIDVRSILRPVHFVPQNQRITRLLRQFQRDRTYMAVVVDEYGGTEGIITMEDIVEELVGEIQDEYDNETPIVEKVGDDQFRVLASAPITNLNEHLPHPLTESTDYDTLSGMLSFNLGRIPDANEKVVLEDYEFTILKRTRNNVTLVQIRDLAQAE